MPTTSTSSDRMTVDIPRAARLLGISRKAAYAATEPGGDIPTTSVGTRKVVAKGWLAKQLHLTLAEVDTALAALDAPSPNVGEPLKGSSGEASDDPRTNPDLAAKLADDGSPLPTFHPGERVAVRPADTGAPTDG